MAGSIFISRESRLPLSTQQFGYLVERIRLAFHTTDQLYLKNIYSPIDEEGASFISVENEEAIGLRAFFKATTKAKSNAQAEDNYMVFGKLWDELLNKVRGDPRFLADWDSPRDTFF